MCLALHYSKCWREKRPERRDARKWRRGRSMFVAPAEKRGKDSLPEMWQWLGKCKQVAA